MKKYKTPDVTRVWSLYEKGVDHHNRINLYSRTEQAHRFFLGEQWYGLDGDAQSLPVLNIIQPTKWRLFRKTTCLSIFRP